MRSDILKNTKPNPNCIHMCVTNCFLFHVSVTSSCSILIPLPFSSKSPEQIHHLTIKYWYPGMFSSFAPLTFSTPPTFFGPFTFYQITEKWKKKDKVEKNIEDLDAKALRDKINRSHIFFIFNKFSFSLYP